MPTRRTLLKSLALISAAALSRTRTVDAQEAGIPLHDPLRPSFHYLPARNWMNDPCAPIYYQGPYHLFHQYNPHAAVWGDMHWAHAVSPDMVHWQRLPVALAPTPGSADAQGCFTGTAVLQNGRPTILYTGVQTVPRTDATLADGNNTFRESQCLAVATDDTLETWKKLPAPVIATPPPGMSVTGFRDPSPWREGSTWYAVGGSGIAKKGGMVLLYRSPDLRTWEFLHPLVEGTWSGSPGPNPVDTGEMWECPDFFPLPDSRTGARKHILIYSTQGKVLWLSGTLDTVAMRFHPENNGELDYGRVGSHRVTFYAPKTQLDASGNRILWGWISETRPEAEYSRAGWSGMMSLPRVLTMHDGDLHMQPAQQVGRLRNVSAQHEYTHEFLATLLQSPATQSRPQPPFLVSDTTGTLLEIQSDPAQDLRTLRVSFSNGVEPIVIPLPAPLSAQARVHAFFDSSVLEIFLDDRFCITHRFYSRTPDKPIATITLAGIRSVARPQTFALSPIWPV